jgi:4a-hydroxytetrahydrobiopterin dehydratase
MTQELTYNHKEIEALLIEELSAWYFEDQWIQRKYVTSGWKGTLMVINVIGHLAEAAWHHPEISASYDHAIIKLMTHSAKGVTDKDFELAKKIEEVVMWQPGLDESSSLDGTPDKEQFQYVVYV